MSESMNFPRQFYLEDIPLDEAWAVFRAALDEAGLWRPLGAETVPLSEANGRVTAAAVWARLSSPHYHAAAMDGYAVRAEDTVGATEGGPITFVVETEGRGSGGAEEQRGRGAEELPITPAPLHPCTLSPLHPTFPTPSQSTPAIRFPPGPTPSS